MHWTFSCQVSWKTALRAHAGPTLQPLLCLTMIVKDEASSIQAVLRNAFQFVDRWAILDTGSTDGTQVCAVLCVLVCACARAIAEAVW